jgi:phosphatidylserine/phosphatidylglycerophosphate/cardiolipin synthase-like enzyme
MAKFVTAKDALSELEKIISQAEKELVLVSPFVRPAADIRERLLHADQRGVRITLIYGKAELDENFRKEFERYQHLRLYFFSSLHAKCYHNEKRMVITSLNLIESSEHNFEMGVAVEAGDPVFADAIREIDFIKSRAEPRPLPKRKGAGTAGRTSPQAAHGFCIRCSKQIQLDPEKPYCATCFASWSRWENWEFEEKACHRCGRAHVSSRMKPQCYACFKATAARG